MVMPLRIIFFGTPAFATVSLEALLTSAHKVCAVITQPDRPSGRGQLVHPPPVKTTAVSHGLPVLQPERLLEPALLDAVGSWQPDLAVVASYGKLIPEALLNVPRLGTINVHASLLPLYRGAAPVHRAIIDGMTVTGVSIMRVTRELDAGPVFARVKRSIGADETSELVEHDLAILGADLLVDVVNRLANGTIDERPQDTRAATYAMRLTKVDGLIDWSLSATAIHNRVRGLYSWPHAYSFLDGHRLVLLRTRPEPASGGTAPGTVLESAMGVLAVATGRAGRLVVEVLRLDGRRPMAARDYLAGHPIAPGERFSNS
jgi:methionyl-tRNA formyltransferase